MKATPLRIAAWKGYTKLAEVLIKYGANVNMKDKDGSTPLHHAALSGHKEMAKLLIKHGAIKDARDKVGLTPLQRAIGKRNITLVELLK